MDDVLLVSAKEFKARCLAIFKNLEARRVGRLGARPRVQAVAWAASEYPRATILSHAEVGHLRALAC